MAASGSFARLLKSSKAIHIDPAIPITSTTYGGFAHRQDHGLKRPLPKLAVPFVKVSQIDSPYRQTDWVGSSREAHFVKRWDESGVAVGSIDDASLEHDLYASPEMTEREGNMTHVESVDIAILTDKEFEDYLAEIRKRRPQFREFVAQRETDARRLQATQLRGNTAPAQDIRPVETEEVDLYQHATQLRDGMSRVKRFLHEEAPLPPKIQDKIDKESPTGSLHARHPALGLTYTPHSQFDNVVLNEPLPGFYLAPEMLETSAKGLAAFLGTVAGQQGTGLSDPKWHQSRNKSATPGKVDFIVRSAPVFPTDTQSRDRYTSPQDRIKALIEAASETARKRPSRAKRQPRSNLSLVPPKAVGVNIAPTTNINRLAKLQYPIGSSEWIAQNSTKETQPTLDFTRSSRSRPSLLRSRGSSGGLPTRQAKGDPKQRRAADPWTAVRQNKAEDAKALENLLKS
ncbi:uncharacterized protein L969DRAFT_20347 [Mixia osmundae IAM 14324]|uniref:Uncharacterized protein n=1 Tax=Mixia osmundae (strain CBS 9802 / IAM 14324 / JCM 22182 / KY 12970) TaxID=764103 RepID=G7DV47_MIXOS|nr:uncharacterized protein L969DRAFT_20347 [Mixia osmundae IAM 14324]KEI36326.1 hypothetical protein L969DRAFT_20347 [Mixia osmundae IAM 14324]GAA94457.1 hypothetical protein E5Q_01109 [Mixia osmundae IAM 14324]